MATLKIPEFKTIIYNLNTSTGYYEKRPDRIPFNKLPNELKVEETQDERIKRNGAKEIIRGRIKDKKYTFFTGLIPCKYTDLFRGDHYEFIQVQKKNSLVLFNFSNDNRLLTVYFFNHFTVYPSALDLFINEFWKKQRGAI